MSYFFTVNVDCVVVLVVCPGTTCGAASAAARATRRGRKVEARRGMGAPAWKATVERWERRRCGAEAVTALTGRVAPLATRRRSETTTREIALVPRVPYDTLRDT